MKTVKAANDYAEFLSNLKNQISKARLNASVAVNKELTLLYWEIGRNLIEKQKLEGWGSKIVQTLADDLSREFPESKGFSVRNLKYMKSFAEAYNDISFVQQVAAQIPWFHNCIILQKVKNIAEREFYILKSAKNAWSRNVLVNQIDCNLYSRNGKSQNNFSLTLPKEYHERTTQLLKDPYSFDFLGIGGAVSEKELESKLIEKLKKFLLELGRGFSYIGSQYNLNVAGQDYYVDLLFYHVGLHCYIPVELKISDFLPEYAGKMNFYLSVIDKKLKSRNDNPSIGLILCKSKNNLIVEYFLANTQKPIGVSTYTYNKPPKSVISKLPTLKEIEENIFIKNEISKGKK